MGPREWVKENLPFLRPIVRWMRRAPRRSRARIVRSPGDIKRLTARVIARGLPSDTVERRFERHYRMNLWRGGESRSGPGSSLHETAAVREALPGLVERLGVRSLLDIPCGDLYWMKELQLDLDSYIGADVVSEIVDENKARFASERRTFVRLDLLTDTLPAADLVLCRDCLDHLSTADARAALENLVRSGSTYLLATTYRERQTNPDIRTGDWRPVNLEAHPFGLPAPIELIDERSQKPGYPDKSLGLWRIDDIGASL